MLQLSNYDNDKEDFLNKHVLAPLWPFRLLIWKQWLWKNELVNESYI